MEREIVRLQLTSLEKGKFRKDRTWSSKGIVQTLCTPFLPFRFLIVLSAEHLSKSVWLEDVLSTRMRQTRSVFPKREDILTHQPPAPQTHLGGDSVPTSALPPLPILPAGSA